MNTTPVCPICGKPAEPGASQGLCPECLAKAAMETRSKSQSPEQKKAVETNAATRLAAARAAGASPPQPPISATAPVASGLAGWKIALLIGGLVALLLLLVASLLVAVAVNGKHQTPRHEGLVAFWPGDGNAKDSIGRNNASLTPGVSFAPAQVGRGFQLNDASAFVTIPASRSLDVGANGAGLTLECWIKPNDVTAQHPIFEWNEGPSTRNVGVHLWVGSGGSGILYANLIDTDNNSHPVSSPLDAVVPNEFQHVALTYDRTSGNAVLYVNGEAVTNEDIGSFVPQTSFNLYIGKRPSDSSGDSTFGCFFDGIVAQPAVYNRALSASEIASDYKSGGTPKKSRSVQKLPAAIAAAMNANDFARVQSLAAEVTRQDPQFAEAWVAEGMASARLGQSDRVRQDYERALRLYADKSRQNPSDANPVCQQIFLLALLDRPREAETLLAQARTSYPNDRQLATMAEHFPEMRIGFTNWMVKSQ
jgi:hypothetical protein